MTKTSTRSDLLVVGGGLAALSVIRSVRERGDTRSIMVLAAEEGEPYDRPPLSKQVLTEGMERDAHSLVRPSEIEGLRVEWRNGTRAVALNPEGAVITDDGRAWSADDIVIATGAAPRPLPEALRLPGVMTLRTRDDAEVLQARLAEQGHLIIVGAGFIGLEVAASARERGCAVTVIEAAPVPLSRVLGAEVGAWFAELHSSRGVQMRCGRTIETARQASGDRVAMQLSDGESLAGDAVLVGIGVQPTTDWIEQSGIDVTDGVLCDAQGRTSRKGVWAVGDVARWPHPTTGKPMRVEQWQSAVDQGRVVGESLTGGPSAAVQVPYFWSDQHGKKIQFAGLSTPEHEVLHVDRESIAVMFLSEGRAVGLLTVDRPRALALGRRVLAQEGNPDAVRDLLR
ncbi:MAG: NAD(P)/FAD-dependent oxidoreductase [Planctomycetota bacterium]